MEISAALHSLKVGGRTSSNNHQIDLPWHADKLWTLTYRSAAFKMAADYSGSLKSAHNPKSVLVYFHAQHTEIIQVPKFEGYTAISVGQESGIKPAFRELLCEYLLASLQRSAESSFTRGEQAQYIIVDCKRCLYEQGKPFDALDITPLTLDEPSVSQELLGARVGQSQAEPAAQVGSMLSVNIGSGLLFPKSCVSHLLASLLQLHCRQLS